MFDDYNIAIPLDLIATVNHLPRSGSLNGGSPRGRDVNACVFSRPVQTKFFHNRSLHGPHESALDLDKVDFCLFLP